MTAAAPRRPVPLVDVVSSIESYRDAFMQLRALTDAMQARSINDEDRAALAGVARYIAYDFHNLADVLAEQLAGQLVFGRDEMGAQ